MVPLPSEKTALLCLQDVCLSACTEHCPALVGVVNLAIKFVKTEKIGYPWTIHVDLLSSLQKDQTHFTKLNVNFGQRKGSCAPCNREQGDQGCTVQHRQTRQNPPLQKADMTPNQEIPLTPQISRKSTQTAIKEEFILKTSAQSDSVGTSSLI